MSSIVYEEENIAYFHVHVHVRAFPMLACCPDVGSCAQPAKDEGPAASRVKSADLRSCTV